MAVRAIAPAATGSASPRIGPPLPARSGRAEFRQTASDIGLTLMPWQDTACRYLTATAPGGLRLYPEVAIVVARQQGKTTLMRPFIIGQLRAGRRIMHIAQTRELPRAMFALIAESLPEELFAKRRGKGGKQQTVWPRFGSGSEEIDLANGGSYRIAAASRGGARGWTNDVVIIDELREMETFDVISSAEPTLKMSPDPQIVYLSNAGDDDSVVLNSVRARAGKDDNLAYLEWSAAPERHAGDLEGWAEANPALGHYPSVLRSLERDYRKHQLAGTMSIFETENLCRWVVSMRERLVEEAAWAACEVEELGKPRRPVLGVSMDPAGKRASAALAWQLPGGNRVALQLLYDVVGSPIDVDLLGADLKQAALRYGVREWAYDPMTDRELAKYARKAHAVGGNEFANASSRMYTEVQAGNLSWSDCAAVSDDLAWTTRKQHDESGHFMAVRADDERPITAALAAIRAVWLASGPALTGGARIW